MGNVWHKPRYVRDDYDPATGELRAEVIHPGLYFEDDEALRSFRRSARIRNRKIEPSILGAPARYDGVALRVATPEQVVRFKLTARTMEGPDPSDETMEKLARMANALGIPVARAPQSGQIPRTDFKAKSGFALNTDQLPAAELGGKR